MFLVDGIIFWRHNSVLNLADKEIMRVSEKYRVHQTSNVQS